VLSSKSAKILQFFSPDCGSIPSWNGQTSPLWGKSKTVYLCIC